jgi:hypothetical protein
MPGRAEVHRRAGRGRDRFAQRAGPPRGGLVASSAPQLQGILNQALDAADWFGSAHQAEVFKAAGTADAEERLRAVRTLIAEETGVSMLIGVAVGYELAHLLMDSNEGD